ncbi:phage late control D family protein [Campylobacter sp. RM16192]|uniref:phage late control D family protein n=1 Tax=Campylobacter sp. RM16192 TaxID=1660080 RepID=UPI0014528312|nr:phage tail protein [Campylobacter sp. RM16192]QCD52225.1 phage protein D [Campylobacter sp. RM16192]
MVRVPNFKLIASGKDITNIIKLNLISLSYEDKESNESDEISFKVSGIYAKLVFGDSLRLWLGYDENLYLCGSFSVQTASRDYKANTTEVRATAVNFASPQKTKKRRSWENTTIFDIAKKIASENSLSSKLLGSDQNIASTLQNDVNDIEYLYGLCFEYGFLMAIKNDTIIIATKDAKGDDTKTSNTPKNTSLPSFSLNLDELYTLEITEANRNSYTAVVVEWQDISEGKTKSIKVGSGEQVYKMQISQPKTDNEAYKIAEAKLNELQRGGINGRCALPGANIVAGGKIKFKDVIGLESSEFSIKSVSHSLSSTNYSIEIEFEG